MIREMRLPQPKGCCDFIAIELLGAVCLLSKAKPFHLVGNFIVCNEDCYHYVGPFIQPPIQGGYYTLP